MRYISQVRNSGVTLAKEGAGRLYYRIGMQYAPANLISSQWITGSRWSGCTRLLMTGDVTRDKDGHGRSSRSTGEGEADNDEHGATLSRCLVDPMRGFEAMNPELAVTGNVRRMRRTNQTSTGGVTQHWFEHQNMRDERVEAFTSLLWEGVYIIHT